MPQTIGNIEAEALMLPRGARAKVALHLLDSLEHEVTEISPEAIEKAWIEESARRIEAYRKGETKVCPVADVIAGLERPSE